MASKYEVEVQRASSDKNAHPIGKLTGSVRTIGLNNLKTGDIVTIPAEFKSFSQNIPGSDKSAEFIIANINRDGQELALRFYPSSFSKMVVPVDEDYNRQTLVHASGNVVDFVQQYAGLQEAVEALVGRPFTATLTPVKAVNYEARDKDELTEDDCRNTHIPTYTFVD